MKIKVVRSIANSLCQMCCSSRMSSSLERLADLPDGTVQIDLLSGSCSHTAFGDMHLPAIEEFRSWLSQRLEEENIGIGVFRRAECSLSYTTDRVPTDRKRIVLFELECASLFELGDQIIQGNATNTVWHQRKAG
jgi:hypothetical protein